jgi:predicted nuclease with TOPRIM domain
MSEKEYMFDDDELNEAFYLIRAGGDAQGTKEKLIRARLADLATLRTDLQVKQSLLDEAIRKGLQLCEQNGTLLMEAHTRDAEIAEARRRLEELENAEYVYRSDHDVIGDGDIRTGHSWDHMRHSGDRARAFLAAKAERKS